MKIKMLTEYFDKELNFQPWHVGDVFNVKESDDYYIITDDIPNAPLEYGIDKNTINKDFVLLEA